MATIPTVVRYSPEGVRCLVNAHEAAEWERQGYTDAPPAKVDKPPKGGRPMPPGVTLPPEMPRTDPRSTGATGTHPNGSAGTGSAPTDDGTTVT